MSSNNNFGDVAGTVTTGGPTTSSTYYMQLQMINKSLEQRVAQLEKLVQQLQNQVGQPQPHVPYTPYITTPYIPPTITPTPYYPNWSNTWTINCQAGSIGMHTQTLLNENKNGEWTNATYPPNFSGSLN